MQDNEGLTEGDRGGEFYEAVVRVEAVIEAEEGAYSLKKRKGFR